MRNISTSNRKPSAAGSGVRTEALWVTCRPPYPLCHSGYPSGSSSLHNDNVVKAQTANPRTPFPDRQSAHILSQYLSCHCSNPSFPPSQPSLRLLPTPTALSGVSSAIAQAQAVPSALTKQSIKTNRAELSCQISCPREATVVQQQVDASSVA